MNITYTEKMTSEEYNEIRKAVNWELLTKGQAERGLNHTTFLVAARDHGRIIGMGRILFDFGYTAYLGDVIISPDYQGNGIGKTIVETLINKVIEAADSGDMIMFMMGAAKGKEKFYEKMGFTVRPSECYGHGMTKIVTA